MADLDPVNRERAAQEKRRWVRITRACNNRCLFCLDADIQTGEFLDPAGLKKEIKAGVDQGCRRLILSGGEPTIHPAYLELLAYGKEAGYGWIQTITNGRMFAYEKFAQRAVDAGLDETTFSMHGHTRELHDHLVGVAGAFEQSMRGLATLRQSGVVVSVDVVINALNVTRLPEILDFFMANGIGEFDLLWLVPFGRAWRNRTELFVDPRLAFRYLREAIRLARGRQAVLWTNRLPAALLEGAEDLIQDPHKLRDEVRGRKPEFEAYIEKGEALQCRAPERCAWCSMNAFCDELERLKERVDRGGWPPPRPERDVAGDPEVLDGLAAGNGAVEVVLNRRTASWVKENAAIIREQPDRFFFSLQTFGSLAELDREGVDPVEALLPLSPLAVNLINLPPCLLPTARPVREESADAGLVGPDGRIDLESFTGHFILHGARAYAMRCEECRARPECPGLPVNHVRRYGFQAARPQREGQELCGLDLDGEGRASMVVRTPCSNACSFCTTRIIGLENRSPWEVDGFEKIRRTLEEVRKKGYRRLRLAAIEPLEHPDIVRVLKNASELGFSDLEVWSHGGPLSDLDFARAVLEAGLTSLDVPVFGPGADIHDGIAGRAGAYRQTVAGLSNLRSLGFSRIASHMVLARGNHDLVAETLLACEDNAFGPVASIVLAAPSSTDPEWYRPVAFSFGEMAAGLRRARENVLDRFFTRVVSQLASVVPSCVLLKHFPDQASLIRALPPSRVGGACVEIKSYGEGLDAEGQATRGFDLKKHSRCPRADRCDLAGGCPGVIGMYLEIYGDSELECPLGRI
jgi:MoaA/NifB/PqqE/SkfB family radical SAM enzyme